MSKSYVMRKLNIEEKNRIADHLAFFNESLRSGQIDIHEFARRVEKLLQFVKGIIEKREAALDERVWGAGDYD
jgi:hypothetical protein